MRLVIKFTGILLVQGSLDPQTVFRPNVYEEYFDSDRVETFQLIVVKTDVTELNTVFESAGCGWRRRPPDMDGSCECTE
jgi:hypothetical protein